jgi:hypothetical protein
MAACHPKMIYRSYADRLLLSSSKFFCHSSALILISKTNLVVHQKIFFPDFFHNPPEQSNLLIYKQFINSVSTSSLQLLNIPLSPVSVL